MKATSTPGQLALFDTATSSDGTSGASPAGTAQTAVDTVLRDLAAGLEAGRLAALTHGELSCVLLRFGCRPRSLAETGRAMNVSRLHARRIERSAVRKLAGINRLVAA